MRDHCCLGSALCGRSGKAGRVPRAAAAGPGALSLPDRGRYTGRRTALLIDLIVSLVVLILCIFACANVLRWSTGLSPPDRRCPAVCLRRQPGVSAQFLRRNGHVQPGRPGSQCVADLPVAALRHGGGVRLADSSRRQAGIVAHADCAVACRCRRMALIRRRCSLILGVVFNVKEFHVLSLTRSQCGHGTIFDFIRFQE
jgi:hypothetical protein